MIPTLDPPAVAIDDMPAARFWQSPTWDAQADRWLELVDRVRATDSDLADAIEDELADVVGEAAGGHL